MALDDFDILDDAQPPATTPAAAPDAKQATAFIAKPEAAPFPAPNASLSATSVTARAKKPANPDDEDLFDFPVVEMKFEADAAKKSALTPVAPPAQPAQAPASAPVKPPAQAGPAAKPAPAKEPAKLATGDVRPQDKQDVAKAAQLVEDIEHVLGADGKPRKRAPALQGPSPLALVGIGVLVLTNVLGLLFLWHTSRSFQTSVQAMNQQLVEHMRIQTLLQSQPAAGQGSAGGASAGGANAHAPAPLEAFEQTALQMAREEIQAGEYAAARRRLSRLLAAADRIEAEAREDIEAQASFLLASTYRKQAEAAREKSP